MITRYLFFLLTTRKLTHCFWVFVFQFYGLSIFQSRKRKVSCRHWEDDDLLFFISHRIKGGSTVYLQSWLILRKNICTTLEWNKHKITLDPPSSPKMEEGLSRVILCFDSFVFRDIGTTKIFVFYGFYNKILFLFLFCLIKK